jgi:hypothetical protein
VVSLNGIFISDTHALAVLPDVAHFALDKEFSSAFIIVACESSEKSQKVHSG